MMVFCKSFAIEISLYNKSNMLQCGFGSHINHVHAQALLLWHFCQILLNNKN